MSYTPLKGKWNSMAGVTEQAPGSPEQGYWTADPNVDYGQAPEAGMGQFFDQEGNFAGWTGGKVGDSGSGLFGSFGGDQTVRQYHIDPTTGQLLAPTTQTHTPSRNSGTSFMSYAVPIAMMAGLGAGAAGGAFSGAAGAEGLGMGAGAAPGEAAGAFTGSFGSGAGAGSGSWGLSDIMKYAQQAKQGFGAVNTVMGGGAGGGMSRTGASGGGASAPRNWLDQVFGVGAGGYSEGQNRDAFRNLNELFSRREMARQPYEQRLAESYADGGRSFLNSDAYQSQARIEQNKLDRGAAKAGRLANDADRDVLMQDHALSSLEKLRGGLRDSLAQEPLPFELFRDAQTRKGNAGGAAFGGLGYSGAAGGLEDIMKLLGGNGFSPNVDGVNIPGGYGSGAGNPEDNFPSIESYPGFESDFPASDVNWDNWDWSADGSWMNDIASWF